MSDIIQLLPDSIANQIAAGEVVQRPASAVKELLENAIDSGATNIQLIIKDGGRTLIQVIDNGCGMSDTDARLCFERHATSKIRKAEDLFAIRTMGFRGEALASIAAVARVELKTKTFDNELGTCVIIEGSDVKEQQPCQAPNGTSMSVKDLFFNIPARRNFLKSDNVEMGHIEEEFRRVALVNTNIGFTLYNNGKLLYKMDPSTLHERIAALFGNNYRQRLYPVEENTDIVKLKGYICKAEFAKKTRGEQYLFVNKRFIKNYYLNNAIEKAYADMLPEKNFPSYFIDLEVDPSRIDINIHPTKTEVKFLDEHAIYSILKAAAKKSLGQFTFGHELDFNPLDGLNEIPVDKDNYTPKAPNISINPNFNPFESQHRSEGGGKGTSGNTSHSTSKNNNDWQRFFEITNENNTLNNPSQNIEIETTEIVESKLFDDIPQNDNPAETTTNTIQIGRRFIVCEVQAGLLLINQQRATERIIYDRLMANDMKNHASQTLLFPINCNFSPSDSEILSEIDDEIKHFGFRIDKLGANNFVVSAAPADLGDENVQETLEQIVSDYKSNLLQQSYTRPQSVALSLARRLSTKEGTVLQPQEMQSIVKQLFECAIPDQSPSGKRTMNIININELSEKLK
ncbi:MAG: DNA mismatch repair endonuclease MutL [Bacteroidales bacterium]|nr:DNA mismatch repair endonuclease MutL [Bacteroidales bacterium]